MFDDKVARAITERDLGSLRIVEEPFQPEPVGPEAQKLNRLGRTYRDRGNMLDTRASIEHGRGRSAQLYREAKVCHDLAEGYFEEAKILSHYGSKGMKWGVRRTKRQLKEAKKAGTSGTKLKKAAGKLSSEDLQTHVKRMNLEKQYVKLSKEANTKTKTRMERGKAEMAKIAKKSARKVVQTQTDLVLKTAVDKAIARSARAKRLTGVT